MVPFVLSISHHFVIDKSKKKKRRSLLLTKCNEPTWLLPNSINMSAVGGEKCKKISFHLLLHLLWHFELFDTLLAHIIFPLLSVSPSLFRSFFQQFINSLFWNQLGTAGKTCCRSFCNLTSCLHRQQQMHGCCCCRCCTCCRCCCCCKCTACTTHSLSCWLSTWALFHPLASVYYALKF